MNGDNGFGNGRLREGQEPLSFHITMTTLCAVVLIGPLVWRACEVFSRSNPEPKPTTPCPCACERDGGAQ